MTAQTLYNKLNSGEISKKKFLYEIRKQDLPGITKFNSFNDTITILKNKSIISEKKEKSPELPEIDAPTIDMVSPYEYSKGINYELNLDGVSIIHNLPTESEMVKAQKKVLKNLAKDKYYYSRKLMSPDEKKLEKNNEREYELKKKFIHNNKKGVLREGLEEGTMIQTSNEIDTNRKPSDFNDINAVTDYEDLSEDAKDNLAELPLISVSSLEEFDEALEQGNADINQQFWILESNGKFYFVDTQGYEYARYVGEIFDFSPRQSKDLEEGMYEKQDDTTEDSFSLSHIMDTINEDEKNLDNTSYQAPVEDFPSVFSLSEIMDEIAEEKLNEGVWAVPYSTEQAQKLSNLFKSPIPASEAADILYNFVGDDGFFDDIGRSKEEDPTEDMRFAAISKIMDWIEEFEKNPENFKKEFSPEAIEIYKGLAKELLPEFYNESNSQVSNSKVNVGDIVTISDQEGDYNVKVLSQDEDSGRYSITPVDENGDVIDELDIEVVSEKGLSSFIKEEDGGTIMTDDENQAKKLADQGKNVILKDED